MRSKTKEEGLSRFVIQAGETARKHINRLGKVETRPYPMLMKLPTRLGMNPRPAGFISVLRNREAMNW